MPADFLDETCSCGAELTAIHDPVPAVSESGIYGGEHSPAHQLEIDVQRVLLELAGTNFDSLRIHRIADGICLTGTVRCSRDAIDTVQRIAQEVAGVRRVLNRLVIQSEEPACATLATCAEAAPSEWSEFCF